MATWLVDEVDEQALLILTLQFFVKQSNGYINTELKFQPP